MFQVVRALTELVGTFQVVSSLTDLVGTCVRW